MRLKPNNPRRITDKEAAQLKRDLERFGDLGGVVHNETTDNVVGGNQRAGAFDLLDRGAEVVIAEEYGEPTRTGTVARGYIVWQGERYDYRRVRWDQDTEDAACLVANLRGGTWDWDALGSWDFDLLDDVGFGADLLSELSADAASLAGLLETVEDEPPEDPGAQVDRAEELREKWGVHTGDLWQLGEHRLVCGDCTDPAVVARVMDGEKADAVVTDPPFAVREEDWDRFDSPEGFVRFTRVWLEIAKRHSNCVVTFMADKNVPLLLEAAGHCKIPYRRALVWRKPPGSQFAGASLDGFWFDFEIINVFGEPAHKQAGQTRMSVLEHRTVTGQEHGCEKPVGLLEDLLVGYISDGGAMLDLFAGSGTTGIACERLSRKARMVEISPAYVAVCLQRFLDMTGGTPVLIDQTP